MPNEEHNRNIENINNVEEIYQSFNCETKVSEAPPLRKKRKYEKRKVFCEKIDKSPTPKEESSVTYNEFDVKNYLQGILSSNNLTSSTRFTEYTNENPIKKQEYVQSLFPYTQLNEINSETIEKNINLKLKTEEDIKMKNFEHLNLKIHYDINPLNIRSSTILNFFEVDFFCFWEESFLYEYPIQITILNSYGTILFHDFLDIKKELTKEVSSKAQETALIQRKTCKAEVLFEEQYLAKLNKLFHRGQY